MALREEIEPIVRALLARPERNLTLDVIAEAIGASAVTTDDIEVIFCELERQDRTVGHEPVGSASAELMMTLSAARRLRASLGRAPTSDEIASEAGISVKSVRSALLFARILQR